MNAKTLVIGYGNTLRGDDGAGPHAAERIAALYPSVDCIACTELGPDLAETISHYNRVVFVDASTGTKHLQWQMLHPRTEQVLPASHALLPEALLELSIHLYARCPRRVELVEIPAYDFDFGEELSPLTVVMVERFVRLFMETLGWTEIRQLCDWSGSKDVIENSTESLQQSPSDTPLRGIYSEQSQRVQNDTFNTSATSDQLSLTTDLSRRQDSSLF